MKSSIQKSLEMDLIRRVGMILMVSGKLIAYLDEVERQATAVFLRLVKELSEKENVTENLKATDQMAWVQKMNNIRNRATEIVNAELIYTV